MWLNELGMCDVHTASIHGTDVPALPQARLWLQYDLVPMMMVSKW